MTKVKGEGGPKGLKIDGFSSGATYWRLFIRFLSCNI
jgi:hypothetical protein